MRSRAALIGLVLLAGCDARRTRIGVNIPASARPLVQRIEITALGLEELCPRLSTWAISTCDQSCADAPAAPRPNPMGVVGSVELTLRNGVLEGPDLELGSEGVWEVLVIAYAQDAIVYGCSTVRAGEELTIDTWYPWCAAEEACEQQFRPGCNARPRCDVVLDDPRDVTCTAPDGATAPAWVDADRRDCSEDRPIDGAGSCRIGEVRCTPDDLFDVVQPAVCPSPVEEPCDLASYDPDRDFDCNLSHPTCSIEVCRVPYEMRPCGTGCGVQYCSDRGVWSDCTFGIEICNGEDDNCSGTADDAPLEDMLRICNFGRDADAPAANVCTRGRCLCDAAEPCSGVDTCCDRKGCRDLDNDPDACGRCDNVCTAGQSCLGGTCVASAQDAAVGVPDGGMTMVPDCRTVDQCSPFPHLPRADACVRGVCLCGDRPACEGIHLCCDGACVNARANRDHCGGCNQPCAGVCVGGTCQR